MSEEKLGMAMRDKYWSERNTDEKIYALYNEVMQMRYQLSQVTALLDDMVTHSHADGKVVTPLNRTRQSNQYYVPVALQDTKEPR
jgi:hypothetical protein